MENRKIIYCKITLSAIQMGSSGVSASGQFNDSAVMIVFTGPQEWIGWNLEALVGEAIAAMIMNMLTFHFGVAEGLMKIDR
jgi:hypothetical protein